MPSLIPVCCNCGKNKPDHCHLTVLKGSSSISVSKKKLPQFHVLSEVIISLQHSYIRQHIVVQNALSSLKVRTKTRCSAWLWGRGCSNVAPLLLWPGSGIFWDGRLQSPTLSPPLCCVKYTCYVHPHRKGET